MQPPSSAGSPIAHRRQTARATRAGVACAVATLLVVLAVIGASAQHGTGTSHLNRGAASILLSVLVTLAGMAGVGSLALLFWGLATRKRRNLDGTASQKHPRLLAGGVLMMILACMAGLLALATSRRHLQTLNVLPHAQASGQVSGTTLPLNAAASFATSGIVVALVVAMVAFKLVNSIGWRRALHKMGRFSPELKTEEQAAPSAGSGALGTSLAILSIPDPTVEPDPRRAVIACYIQLLEIAARHGPARRKSETPTEYLRRVLALTDKAAAPAGCLTRLFERARYSRKPVGESMRSEAVDALAALQGSLYARVPT